MSIKIDMARGVSPEIQHLQRIVVDAGGVFVGIQEALLEPYAAKLGFTNPETENYLDISFNPVGYNGSEVFKALRERIEKDNEMASNRHVSVKVADLRRLAKQLLELSQQLDALIERKKS